jgi:mycothiol synthase
MDDLAGMIGVLDACKRADGFERHDTVEEMRVSYSNLTNCDPETDVLIAEGPDGIVGYARVTWNVETVTDIRTLLQFGWVVPDVRGRGVGTAMLGWCEARLQEMIADRPHHGKTVFESFYDEGEEAKRRLLEESGYRTNETYAEMTRATSDPLHDCPLPDGLEIRPVTAADARRIWEADVEAFRDHVGFHEPQEEDFRVFVQNPNFDPSLWKVAFDGDAIVGMVLNYVDPGENEEYGRRRGWTEDISVQRPWRGRGVAKAIIARSIEMFRDMGMTETALGVHTANPTGAFRLYEAMGYRVASLSRDLRKPFAPEPDHPGRARR